MYRKQARMAKGPLLLAVAAVLGAWLASQALTKVRQIANSRFNGSFEALVPDVWRQGYHWVTMVRQHILPQTLLR